MREQVPFRGVLERFSRFESALSMTRRDRSALRRAISSGRNVTFSIGRNIEARAESSVALISEGRVSLHIAARAAREIFVKEYTAGDILHLPLYEDEDDFVVRYSIEERSSVFISTIKSLVADARHVDDILDDLNDVGQRFKSDCFRVMYKLAFMPVTHRLYCELLRLDAESNGAGAFELPSHQHLAQRLISTRETVSREMAFLRKQGIIDTKGDRATLVDRRFLMRKIRTALDLETEGDVNAYIG